MSTFFLRVLRSPASIIKGLCAVLGLCLITTLPCRAALPNLTVNYSYSSGVSSETADQTISTSGTVQVSSGAQATFNAGVKITLSPGFYAQSGSYFHTAITGAPLDSDGDGIPDYWEIQYGLNPNNAADAALDPNGNGLTNLQEYVAGNNPLPTGLTYELHYDTNQRGQLTAIKKADNTPLVVYTYLADQRRASRWLSNNTQTDYGYDGAGRMTLLDNYRVPDSSEIQKQEYGYDLRDRRTWTQRDGNLGDTYAYQADSQLTDFKLNASNPRATPSGWTQEVSYAYDPVGNRTGVTNNGAFTSYSVDHANQYTAVTGATVQYGDGRGNVTQWNAWTYTYDADNRMLSATKTGMSITFAYDPAGRLVKRVTNGQTEFFCYDGAQQLMRTDQNATLLSSTIWGPNPDEVLVDSTPQNGNRYFHSDIQGTTVAVTDDSRVVLERYRYDPYGNTTFYDANWNQRSATAYNVRFLYTGQERMWAADGLYNYKSRFYSTDLGRFFQADPARLNAGDLNLFRYCDNDPFDKVDPMGLESREMDGSNRNKRNYETDAEIVHDNQVAASSAGRPVDDLRIEANKPGSTPPKLWPAPPEKVIGSKPKWNPKGYWEGKAGRKITWDDRAHGTGQDRGSGPQGGHWDGANGGRWRPDGTALPFAQVDPLNFIQRWSVSVSETSIQRAQYGAYGTIAVGVIGLTGGLAAPLAAPYLTIGAGTAVLAGAH